MELQALLYSTQLMPRGWWHLYVKVDPVIIGANGGLAPSHYLNQSWHNCQLGLRPSWTHFNEILFVISKFLFKNDAFKLKNYDTIWWPILWLKKRKYWTSWDAYLTTVWPPHSMLFIGLRLIVKKTQKNHHLKQNSELWTLLPLYPATMPPIPATVIKAALCSTAVSSRTEARLSIIATIPPWISNHIPRKVWDEIIYPFPNLNGCTIEVWKWRSILIPHFTMDVMTYPCWN